jgi:hypothetical protein
MSLTLVTYDKLTCDINATLNTGATPNLCLFIDAAGEVPYTDASGNIYDPATVSSVNYTQPHNDAEGNPILNGFVSITFSSGNVVTITDTVDTVYYSILSVPFKPRSFN